MARKLEISIFAALIYFITVVSVSAEAPAQGLVIEGASVPAVALGDSRHHVASQYGPPTYCQSITAGDLASCTFAVAGGGQVSVRFTGESGGNAANDPSDLVHGISWGQGVEWETFAGVTAAIALNNPEALLLAYPNAEVTYHSFTGEIFRVLDLSMGIDITRWFNFYSGTTTVRMAIFPPQTSN